MNGTAATPARTARSVPPSTVSGPPCWSITITPVLASGRGCCLDVYARGYGRVTQRVLAGLGRSAVRDRRRRRAGAGLGARPQRPVGPRLALSVAPSITRAWNPPAADAPQALALLTLVAWLGPEPVPLSLLTEHADHLPAVLAGAARDRSQLADGAATLGDRALARVDADSVQMHRMPADQLVGRTVDERPDDAGWATCGVP